MLQVPVDRQVPSWSFVAWLWPFGSLWTVSEPTGSQHVAACPRHSQAISHCWLASRVVIFAQPKSLPQPFLVMVVLGITPEPQEFEAIFYLCPQP